MIAQHKYRLSLRSLDGWRLPAGRHRSGRGVHRASSRLRSPVRAGRVARVYPSLQLLRCAGRRKSEIEEDFNVARNDVAGARPAVNIGNLPGCRREVRVARVPYRRRQFGDGRGRWQDGSGSGEMRVAMCPCTPFTVRRPDSEPRRPFLSVSSVANNGSRFADQAEIHCFTTLAQGVDHRRRPVDGITFFVGGEQ